jgi:hypothetical protein
VKVSETCSCGASFGIEVKAENAIRWVREWRRKHHCPAQEEEDPGSAALNAFIDMAEEHTVPEMQIGFRYFPEEDEE